MAVVKFKPTQSPRVLEARVQEAHEHTKKAVQRSQNAVARSRELIKQTKAVITATRKQKTGS